MLFNSIPTYLLTEMKGPLLAEFTLQSQSQSKKNSIPDEDRPRCSRPKLTPQQQDTHAKYHQTINVHLDHHIFSKGDWRRARLSDHARITITISLIRLSTTSHCSNNNKLTDIHSEVSANTESHLPFKSGRNNLFQPLPSQLLRHGMAA